MPIDHTILGQVQPVQVGTPQQWEGDTLTLRQMTNQAEIQEAALDDRRLQLQAEAADRRENQEMGQALEAANGDLDDAWPALARINLDKAFGIKQQYQEARQADQDSFSTHLENETKRLDLGSQVVGAFAATLGKPKEHPGAWEMMRQKLTEIDPDLSESMPVDYHSGGEEWVQRTAAMGLTEEQRIEGANEMLKAVMNGEHDRGSATFLQHSTDLEDYEEDKGVLRRMGVPASVLSSFPDWPMDAGQGLPRDDPHVEQFIADMESRTMTTLDQAKLAADQAKQAQAADIEAGRAGREQQRIDVSARQAAVAEGRLGIAEEEAVAKATGAAGAAVQGTGEAANRFRVAAAAAVEEKGGEPLTAAENWQIYKDTVIGADDKTLTGRKPLTSNELSNIEQWRYDELSELEAPDATWMEPDELQTATVAYDKQRAFIEETYTRRLNGGPPPPKRYATSKKVWTMTIAQRQAVDEVLKQGGVRPTPDHVQTFLKNNPAFRQQLGLKEHKN